jgi:purine-binding chemotaxis protein CheW
MIEPNAAREILKTRARALARPAAAEPVKGQTLEVIEFRLAQERYAIEHAFVREVVSLKDLTPLPCTPAFISGIMNLRGQILPLIDMKKFFDLPEVGITDLHMVIVVHAGDVELGILADSIAGVVSIPLDVIQPSLPTLTGIRSKYLKGVTDQLLVILDVPKILSDPKIVVDEEVQV